MKHIVVYKITLITGLLLIITSLAAQKPTIDLLPSSHQYMHPEAMIDTSLTSDSLVQFIPPIGPPYINKDTLRKESVKKERRQIGPNLDTIFHRDEARKTPGEIRSMGLPLHIKYFNPIKLFIHITAVK